MAEQQMKFSQKRVEEQQDYIARLEKELLESKMALKTADASRQNAEQKALNLSNENLALKGQNMLVVHKPNIGHKRPRKDFEKLGSPVVEMEQDEDTALMIVE